MVFGECGQGKSTTLNEIVEIVAETYYQNKDHGCKFKSMESLKSVTSCVQMGSVGNMILIDTPGLNDPDARRTDKNIHIEMIKSLSMHLYDPLQGISSLILCIMPNESQRITDSALKGLSSMLFMFNSLDERTDIEFQPKFHIVINNVSRYGDDYDIEAVEKDPEANQIEADSNLSVEKRIEEFKT